MKALAAELFLKQYSGRKGEKKKKRTLFWMSEKLEMVKLHKGFASSVVRFGSDVYN